MVEEVTFEAIAPVVPVRDLDAALDRYRRLGFSVRSTPAASGTGSSSAAPSPCT